MTVASILDNPETTCVYAEFLTPEPLADGRAPEVRLVCGISWERYLAFDKALGDDRPGPRFYYLDGELEIMTTSGEHERIKKQLAGFMDIYFDHAGTGVVPRGQATMRLALRQAGAEPDESWCINEEKEFPDLVLEIAPTSGGVSRLELYRRFQVPEVWFWRKGKLDVFALRAEKDGYDQLQAAGGLLPDLDVGLLERCVLIQSWREARRTFRAGLTAS